MCLSICFQKSDKDLRTALSSFEIVWHLNFLCVYALHSLCFCIYFPLVSPSLNQATLKLWLSLQELEGSKLWRTNPHIAFWVIMHVFYSRWGPSGPWVQSLSSRHANKQHIGFLCDSCCFVPHSPTLLLPEWTQISVNCPHAIAAVWFYFFYYYRHHLVGRSETFNNDPLHVWLGWTEVHRMSDLYG